MPYHALTGPERGTYNARRRLLERLGHHLRFAAVERERCRTLADKQSGRISESSFVIVPTLSFSSRVLTLLFQPFDLI